MAKGNGNPAGKRPSSRNAKPYDANNSFVRKMATKVTDFIPQSSWIGKWFNTSQDNEDALEGRENTEEIEFEDEVQPPNKRARIRMDVIHPPGTFSIQTRAKTTLNTIDSSKEQYPVHNEMTEDFLEPAIAGPSGISHLISSTPAAQADIRSVTSNRSDLNSLASSTNNGIVNGTDDNSESSESTSGCSSLIPQINRHEGPLNLYNSTFPSRKRHIDDKLTFTNHLQSPRSLFLDSNSRDTLSSRRPSFNASIITNTLDRASPLSSPFYNGNTTFGGANTAGLYKRSRNFFSNSSELQLKVPRRTNVEVKPPNATVDSSGMSQTAKKILEALEHFSSPITDAKKIPLKSTNSAMSSIMSRKREREEIASPSARIGLRHLTRELTVPTVPDILKLRRRQKLQDTTLVARKIVSARSDPPPPSQDYRLRTEDTDNEKYRGKLKGKSKINLEQEETVAPVNLPNIPLPITTLPNFDFALPPPTSHSASKTVANKENTFTFASPIKVTDAEKSLQSVNNFTFSNPIDAEESTSNMINSSSYSATQNIGSSASSVHIVTTSMPNFIWSGSSTAPRLKAKAKNSKDNLVSSVVARELQPKIVIDKQNDAKSVSCTTLKPENNSMTQQSQIKSQSYDLMEKFKPAEGSWECPGCLLRNAADVITCPCCNASNPISIKTNTKKTNTIAEVPPAQKLSATNVENTTTQGTVSSNDDIMNKFKPSKDSWECPGCLLRNNSSVMTCPCCNASKPGSVGESSKTDETSTNGFGDKFKKPEGAWICDSCLLQNGAKDTQCVACQALKPGTTKSDESTSNTKPTLQFNFGVPSSTSLTSTSTSSFTFGIQKSELNITNNEAQKTSVAMKEVPSTISLFNNNSEPKTTMAFGTDKPTVFTATVSKPPTFTIPEDKIPTFGSNVENKLPIFGASETKLPVFNPPAATPLPTFVPPSSSATPSLFGSSSTSTFGNNTTLAFGDTTTTPAIFSSTKPSETSTASSSSIFTFGSASSQQPASGGFNFSTNVNPSTSSAKPLFTFGNNSSASQSDSNTFGSATFAPNPVPTSTANFTFNPPKQETSAPFSQQSAITTPIFGGPHTNPQAQIQATSFSNLLPTPSSNIGFNFGSTAPPAAASDGFNFGAMSSTSTTTGGFNFNSPTSAPSIAFDPNSRPSFNFTKGVVPTSFNAPPQSAAAPRKIKKAFRRCMR